MGYTDKETQELSMQITNLKKQIEYGGTLCKHRRAQTEEEVAGGTVVQNFNGEKRTRRSTNYELENSVVVVASTFSPEQRLDKRDELENLIRRKKERREAILAKNVDDLTSKIDDLAASVKGAVEAASSHNEGVTKEVGEDVMKKIEDSTAGLATKEDVQKLMIGSFERPTGISDDAWLDHLQRTGKRAQAEAKTLAQQKKQKDAVYKQYGANAVAFKDEEEQEEVLKKMSNEMRINWKHEMIKKLEVDVGNKKDFEKVEAQFKLAQAKLEMQNLLPITTPNHAENVHSAEVNLDKWQAEHSLAYDKFLVEQRECAEAAHKAKDDRATKRAEMEAAKRRAKELEDELAKEDKPDGEPVPKGKAVAKKTVAKKAGSLAPAKRRRLA